MADSCSNCFFLRAITIDLPQGGHSTVNVCAFNAPPSGVGQDAPKTSLWPVILHPDNWWCGEGADHISLVSFSVGINSLPTPASSTATTVLSGADVPPSNSLGADGNWYWHGSLAEPGGENFVYIKIAGVWALHSKWISG